MWRPRTLGSPSCGGKREKGRGKGRGAFRQASCLALLLVLAACGPKGPASLGPAGPLQAPTSIARAPDGRLVIADGQGVVALDPDTKATELLAKGEAQGAVVAPDGRLVATHADGTLTVDGKTVAEGLREPGRVAVWEGAAAVVEEGAVTRVDLATGEKSPITQLDDPVDLVVLEDGALLILDGFARTLLRYTPEGNQVVADLNAATSQPLGLGLLPDGQVLVVDRDTRRVMALDLSTGHRRLLDSPERGGPFGMSEYTDVDGLADGAAAALSAPDAAVVRVHAEQGRQSLAGPEGSSEATAAIAFALARDGDDVYATDILGARLIRVDPKTGTFTEVSGRNVGSGVPLDLPVGLAVQGGTAWIGDPSQGVVRVDLASGNRERVSGPGRGSGPPMRAAGPLALHQGALYVADRGTRALYRVDLETGKREVVAKDLKGPTAVASDGKRLLLADGDAVRDLSGQEVAEVTAPESLLPDAVGAEAEEAVAGHGLVLGLPSLKPISGGRQGHGPPLDIPPGLARLADGTLLAAQATGRGQIYRIDPRTGNRTALTLLPR